MSKQNNIPDSPGFWGSDDGEIIEVYLLEPVGTLCVWGPEVGVNYSGATETQQCWTTDEWQGHVPVSIYCDGSNWEFFCESYEKGI